MKTLTLTLLALALITPNAFAENIEVQGAKAGQLYEALIAVGVKKEQRTEAARVSVSGVRAGTALTGRGKFGSLELRDVIARKVLRARDPAPNDTRPALALVEAMKAVGLKETVRMGGSSIDAAKIECAVGHHGRIGFYHCEIQE
jgi:hypothetical protein